MFKNKVGALSLAAILCPLLGAAGRTSTANPFSSINSALSSSTGAFSDNSGQISSTMTLSIVLPDANWISLAVAVAPHPFVPRYRRLYNFELVTTELGMLRNG